MGVTVLRSVGTLSELVATLDLSEFEEREGQRIIDDAAAGLDTLRDSNRLCPARVACAAETEANLRREDLPADRIEAILGRELELFDRFMLVGAEEELRSRSCERLWWAIGRNHQIGARSLDVGPLFGRAPVDHRLPVREATPTGRADWR